MRMFFALIYILSASVGAMACSLQGDTSTQNLLDIAQQTSYPSTEYLPKPLINGGSNLYVTNAEGSDLKVDDNLVLTPGMTLATGAGKVKVYIQSTGQTVELEPNTKLKVLQYNKSAHQKICNLSFELQSGHATFSSDHQEREKTCKLTEDPFEVATKNIEVTPMGTKYSVDLNQAIAELNGETAEADENVAVQKGAVQIRLVRLKKSSVAKKAKSKKEVVASADDSQDEEKPIVIKAGNKAKVKKGKKDRLADIQIVYPEQ
ncbi:hypothetical protein CIK05_15915 [Bdellovibrio sp. qaytius]|nr:hypothetical protein CIK05_15915 [Bdellovibrio sp. qaytius]